MPLGIVGRENSRLDRMDARPHVRVAERLAELLPERAAEARQFAQAIAGMGDHPHGNRHYWCSDFMVHRRPGWYASARMHSRRVYNTDAFINSEGKRAHLLADGACCLMRDGGEYDQIAPLWNWQRIPGITAVQRTSLPAPEDNRRFGPTDFVGGVSDGRCGMAAMHHERDGLRARKAWFFLNDCLVCLGAGISDGSGLAVLTTLEQCHARGPVVAGNGWLWHHGWVYLGLGEAVQWHAGERQGDWRDIGANVGAVSGPVFEAFIDHGSSPEDAGYAYAVLPVEHQPDAAAQFGAPATIIANDENHQVLRDGERLYAVCHVAGVVPGSGGVAVDQPCLLIIASDCLQIADPTQTVDSMQITSSCGTQRPVGFPRDAEAGNTVTVHW